VKITTQHSRSSYGIPVILDDRGQVIDYAPGIRLAMDTLGWSKRTLAERTGASVRTVEGWLQGRMPLVSALNVLRDALETTPAPSISPP
jgi:ribosome-binding protein aMBF1 (putative translation factor)